jgi:hypothetical protein
MAKGKGGFTLEAYKFAIYLIIPIGASWYYSDPTRQKESIDYWQFVKYPANPVTGLVEDVRKYKDQEKQRQVYREQLEQLNQQAERMKAIEPIDDNAKKGWFAWLR